MMKGKYNQADKALAIASVLFGAFLLLKLQYPQSICVKALLFCAEAALIGGIADWFAVTALFKKPLGFPYHTEIIPRKREQVIEGCIKLVQQEFFAKKNLIQWLKEKSMMDVLLQNIEKHHGQEKFSDFILTYLESRLEALDMEELARRLDAIVEVEIRNKLAAPYLSQATIAWMNSEKGETKIEALLTQAIAKVEAGAINAKIKSYLDEYMEEKSQGLLSMMMMLMAKQSNVLNVDEITETVQIQLIRNLAAMRDDRNHPMRRSLLDELKRMIQRLPEDREWCQQVEAFKMDVFQRLDSKRLLQDLAVKMLDGLKRPQNIEGGIVRQSPLVEIITANTNQMIQALKNDIAAKQALESYLQEAAARALLEGRNMMAIIIREVLQGLTKTEFNRLIQDKVEQDLIWIRMNGCIVGAAIGLIIFVALQYLHFFN